MRRFFTGLLLFVTLLAGVGPSASAQEDPGAGGPPSPTVSGINMDVRAGFDGAGRLGGWIPLDVELTNQGSEVRAQVQVVVQQGGGRSTFTSAPTTFSLPVVLPRLSHKLFTMDVNLPTVSNKLTARLVSSTGDTLAEQDITMSRVPLGDYFCGVLARDPSSYDFLAALDLPPPIRRVRTAPLDPSTVPDRAQLLGSFDCLIIDNASTSQLSQQQLDALQVWVGTGGLLLEVGGASWRNTLQPLPPALLPVDITGLTSIQSIASLGNLVNTPITAPGPWLVSQSRPRTDRGAQVVVSQDGTPLVVASKLGDGTVIYLGFEPTAQGLRGWSGNEQLWRYLMTHAEVDNGIGSALVRPYLRWGRFPRVGLSDFSTQPKPSLDWLWTLLAGYGLLMGTSLFVLGRRGMVGWAAGSALILTLGTTGVAVGMARQRAEPDAAVTRLSVVRPIDTGDGMGAYTREYVSVLAKRDGAFSFVLPDDSLARSQYFPFPRPNNESDSSWLFQVTEGAHPIVQNLSLKQGQLATAAFDGQLSQAPTVRSDLRIDGGALSGLITNRTGGRLSDATLVIDNQFQSVGTMEANESRQLYAALPPQAGAGNLAPTQIADKLLPPATSNGRPGSAARRDWVESLFTGRFATNRMELKGPTLIGWLDQSPSPILTPDFRISTSDFSLLVQPLEPVLPRGFEGEVPSAAMNRRNLGIGSGTPTDHEYYSVSPGEAVTLQFSLPPAEGRFQLNQLRLNIEGNIVPRTPRSPVPPFTVSLFNWRTSQWEGWDVQTGTNIVPNGDSYVSAAGEVRLRYVLDAGVSSSVREARLTRLDVTPIGSVR